MIYILILIVAAALILYTEKYGPEGLILLGIGAVMGIAALYQVIARALVKLEDRLSERVALPKRKIAFWILFGIETAVVLISALLAEDQTQWAYEILCCTPVGGILSFFNQTEVFTVTFTLSAWLMSGIQFVLTAFVTRESEKIGSSKPVMLLHSMAFTFFSGVVVAFLVDHVFSSLRSGLGLWYDGASTLIRIIPALLILLYYLLAVVFFIVSVQAFIDNLKMLGIVLLCTAGVSLLVRLALYLLAGSKVDITNGLNFFTQLPGNHPFLYQLGLTLFVTAAYSVGQIMFRNVRHNVKEMVADGEAFSEANDKKDVLRYAKHSEFQKKLLKKAAPEIAEEYERKLAETDAETLQAQIDAYEHRGVGDRRAFLAQQYEHDPGVLLRHLQEDYEAGYGSKSLNKMMHQDIGYFCNQWAPNFRTVEESEKALWTTDFAYFRLSYPTTSLTYQNTSSHTSMKWLIPFFLLALLGRALDSSLICTALYFMGGVFFPFGVITFLSQPFLSRRNTNLFETRAGWPALGLSLLLGVLICLRLLAVEDSLMKTYVLLIAAFSAIGFVWILLNLPPIRDRLRRRPSIKRKELRWLYKKAEVQWAVDGSVKRRYPKDQVTAMICCCLRRDEILSYLGYSENRMR
jgi:predicted house-cleaning noncanonical NTP pyrophosphatase (MazG superfamily)